MKINLSRFQNSLSPGATQRPWGLDSLPHTKKGAQRYLPPPSPHPLPCQGHAHWYPMAAAVCQAGASGPSGLSVIPVSPDSELWDIMPRPGGAAVEGTQVPPLGLRAPCLFLLTALLLPFIGTVCMFSFFIFFST